MASTRAVVLGLVGLVALQVACAAGPGEIDITVPGNPLVDGPHPHVRQPFRPLDRSKPYNIGHRGDCGEFPEHSVISYQAAIKLGADFIECCDVVMTKDLVPICRHEPNLSNTTNANDVYPDKVKTYVIDGYNSTGVHAIDLTLKQIEKLRVRERLYSRGSTYDDTYPIVTLEQCFHIQAAAPRVVGIYPETKHPTWHDAIIKQRGHKTTITDAVLKLVTKYGSDNAYASPEWLAKPFFLQSFESKNLAYARSKSKVPSIQLMDDFTAPVPDGSFPTYADMMTADALAKIAKYATGISPWKETLQTVVKNADGTYTYTPTGLVQRAKAAGMQVHTYTLRNEPNYHTAGLTAIGDEYAYYFKTLGLDGAFTDFPGTLAQWFRNETAKATVWSTLKV